MNYIKICLAAACILRLCGPFSVALAGSVTQPGSTLGTAPGAPLPEGFYFSNTADWGVRDPSTRLLVDHPVYIWSTPWMILGARFHVLAETALDANERGGRHAGGFYNPLLTGQLAWDPPHAAEDANCQPQSASARPRDPVCSASLLAALPAFARAKTPSRMTAMRKSAKARWNRVMPSLRPVRSQ